LPKVEQSRRVNRLFLAMKTSHIIVIQLLVVAFTGLFARASTPNAARMFGNAIADVVEKTMPSVVVIRTESRQYRVARDGIFGYMYRVPERLAGQGSGVIMTKDGYVLTNYHVIEGAESVEVVLNDGTKLPATVIGKDEHTDLAVIKIDAAGREFIPMERGDSDQLRVGEFVIALGSPFSLSSSVTLGIVSQKGRSIGLLPFEDFIQTDAAVNKGNSGGPLLDVDGKLVGINTVIQTAGMSEGNIGISFAVPVNLAINVAESVIRTGRWERPWIGILMREAEEGVRVMEVVSDSPASRGGLLAGDVIRKVDEVKTDTVSDVQRTVFKRKIGDPADVEVEREGAIMTIKLVTETMPAPALMLRE
jgi:serine protease Do